MTNLGTWSSQTLTTILSTELNSMADQAYVESSSAYDNTTNLDIYADIQVWIIGRTGGGGWGENFTGAGWTGRCSVMLTCLESVDGTNFATSVATNADAVRSSRLLLAYVPLYGGGATPQTVRATVRNVLIPPTKFKVGLFNNMGTVSLAASGSKVQMRTYGWNTRA
jgi:hypothetical protein